MYKKCDAVMDFAHKEIALVAVAFIFVGLLLTFARYRYWQSMKVPRIIRLPLEILSSLPVTNKLFSKPSQPSHCRNSAGSSKKVSD